MSSLKTHELTPPVLNAFLAWCLIKHGHVRLRVNDQLDALYNTLYNMFIIIIILYMFGATLCSSSGGQIVLVWYSILCKWPSGVHTGRSLTEQNIKKWTR